MTEHRFTRRVFVLAALVALSAASCAWIVDHEDDSDLVTLIINHHRLNVTIFNVAAGHRDRIGEVTAAANAHQGCPPPW